MCTIQWIIVTVDVNGLVLKHHGISSINAEQNLIKPPWISTLDGLNYLLQATIIVHLHKNDISLFVASYL